MIQQYNTQSKVEEFFAQKNYLSHQNESHWKIPTLIVDNYVELGQLTALRFLEWVILNPGGVVALPTGKTPEFFIKWMEYYLNNWKTEANSGLLARLGFEPHKKPDFRSLHFFQLDEFFPIPPDHERSFHYFVQNYYIKGFGFDPAKTHMIDTFHLDSQTSKLLDNKKNLDQIFQNEPVDLNLRSEKPTQEKLLLRKKAIEAYDEFCRAYEEKIRSLGGIGFFLGGIGPDGHIAFNIKGSSHFSPTRLTQINYETQAAAAGDLGGIELVKKKAVITMGLETITYNPDTVAIIIAAGQTKSGVVADAIEREPSLQYPATSLQQLEHSRFFITESTTKNLTLSHQTTQKLYKKKLTDPHLVDDLIIQGANQTDTSLPHAMSSQAKASKSSPWELASKLTGQPSQKLIEATYNRLIGKIEKGLETPNNQSILHTAPHHDDIELAYFPFLHHLVRSTTNSNHFCYLTSGFTAVTNFYVKECIEDLIHDLQEGRLQELEAFPQLQDIGRGQQDITGYLRGISQQNEPILKLHKSARLARRLLQEQSLENFQDLENSAKQILAQLEELEPGRKVPGLIQNIKSWLREFEAELVWAHFGINKDQVHHMRLGFYSDDIFPQYPNYEMDVKPLLELFEAQKPSIITLALDPEGSGPDTHYKSLIALADAIDLYMKNNPDLNLRIWGYRNVWSRYKATEAERIIPVSLNSFATLHNMFNNCFVSQKSASFPSYELNGTFSQLAQKIWVEQHDQITHLVGQDYFYKNPNPLLRRAFGAIYLKDMSYQEFTAHIKDVRRLLKAKEELENNPQD